MFYHHVFDVCVCVCVILRYIENRQCAEVWVLSAKHSSVLNSGVVVVKDRFLGMISSMATNNNHHSYS